MAALFVALAVLTVWLGVSWRRRRIWMRRHEHDVPLGFDDLRAVPAESLAMSRQPGPAARGCTW